MMSSRIASLALAASLALGPAACGSSGHQPTAGKAGRERLAAEPRQGHGQCPRGRPLPPGVGEAIDYIDFFRLDGRSYEAISSPVRPSQLRAATPHLRCSLTA